MLNVLMSVNLYASTFLYSIKIAITINFRSAIDIEVINFQRYLNDPALIHNSRATHKHNRHQENCVSCRDSDRGKQKK